MVPESALSDLDAEHAPENGCPNVESCLLREEVAALREKCRLLEELSFVDALTGLYNFRYLQKSLEMEMERTRRTRLPTGLIMIDLDHFKNVNTLYGHECGNAVLSHFGKVLKEGIRMIDVACRYGGEEFALVLPGASLRQSALIAERLREIIHNGEINFGGRVLTVTASFGVAVFRFSEQSSVSEFLNKADALLYEAKKLGRDRVSVEESVPEFAADEVTDSEKAALFSDEEDE
jgi:two-component system cell cycle response regulator